MAATIHPLFPGLAAAAAARQAPLHPVLAELQQTSLRMLDDTVRGMFDRADDTLFEMGERAPNDGERRRYFDTMRVLRLDRNRVTREFAERLGRGFGSTLQKARTESAFDFDSLSIQPTEELEERIALSNLATKAESQHKGLLWDLERRLEIAQARGIPVSPQALAPSRICEAFGAATGVLETDFQIKLVIFKLFDRALSRDLAPIYTAAIALLDREGIEMRRPAAGSADRAAHPAAGPAGVAHPSFDALRRYGVDPASLKLGHDSAAMAPLLDLLQGLLTQGGHAGLQASAQRLNLAGHMFNELLTEPLLNDVQRAAFEPLRYPLYRTALVDPSFLGSTAHPMRRMMGDLVELAAGMQTGEVPPARFDAVLQSMIAQAEGAAPATPAPASTAADSMEAAFTGRELDSFLADMREQARSRRSSLLLHVRRMIAQELDLRTMGREVPQPVLNLLRSGVGPLMAVRLLKDGRGGASFRAAEGLLERVLESLESGDADSRAGAGDDGHRDEQRRRIVAELESSFDEIGMAGERSTTLIDGLRQVYDVLDEPAVEIGRMGPLTDIEKARILQDYTPEITAQLTETVDARTAASASLNAGLPMITELELLSRVLTPESWFRVFDASQNQTRWLKLASFYANQDSVTFSGFDETTRLSLRASRLADDLVKGHSEPINPTASAREALEQLREAKMRGLL